MNITIKWKEYNAETLVPPCVVQHDTVGKEHLVWVWTGENIVQVSRLKYDEKSILTDVYNSLKEKGYNPVNQLVGYLLSGDPTYITNYNGARALVRKLERDEILEEVIKSYLEIK